jgi:hypothetical protein
MCGMDPVGCRLCIRKYFCFHDICREFWLAQDDYFNARENKLLTSNDIQRYFLKFNDANRAICQVMETFYQHFVEPKWHEAYLRYREDMDTPD